MQNADLSRDQNGQEKQEDRQPKHESPLKSLVEGPFELAKFTPHGKAEDKPTKPEKFDHHRHSKIRQNDFAGYADEEACFDMLDKYYSNKTVEDQPLANQGQTNSNNQYEPIQNRPGVENPGSNDETALAKESHQNIPNSC